MMQGRLVVILTAIVAAAFLIPNDAFVTTTCFPSSQHSQTNKPYCSPAIVRGRLGPYMLVDQERVRAFTSDLPNTVFEMGLGWAYASAESHFGFAQTAKGVVDGCGGNLEGKVAVVTGGNSGIGLEACKALSRAGCRVVMCSRSVHDGEAAIEGEIKMAGMGGYVVDEPDIVVKQLDLEDLDSVERLAAEVIREVGRVDFLVLNAGVLAGPLRYTQYGFERQFGVNYLGHFYLVQQLMPALIAQSQTSQSSSRKSRVVCVSSAAHYFGFVNVDDLNFRKLRQYDPWGAYAQSKLALVLFARALERKHKAQGVSACAVHPGVIATSLWKDTAGWMENSLMPIMTNKNVVQGAGALVHGCVCELHTGGCFFDGTRLAVPSKFARDDKLGDRLWDVSEMLIGEALAARKGMTSSY